MGLFGFGKKKKENNAGSEDILRDEVTSEAADTQQNSESSGTDDVGESAGEEFLETESISQGDTVSDSNLEVEVSVSHADVVRSDIASLVDGMFNPVVLPVQPDDEPVNTEAEDKAYTKKIKDAFVVKRLADLSVDELEAMSITDGAAIWRQFVLYRTNVVKPADDEEKKSDRSKILRFATALSKKILAADSIYVLYSTVTGEPYMFSRTLKGKSGYMCMPPNIRIFTEAFQEIAGRKYPAELFEMKCIEKGEDGQGIIKFLQHCIYENGAQGVEIFSEQAAIGANMLVAPPDYSDMEPINIPVTNPGLMRWMLLMAQLRGAKGENVQLINNLYNNFFMQELMKARFLVPMKLPDQPENEKTDNKQFAIKKDTQMALAVRQGNNKKPALMLYTDWGKFNVLYRGWGGLIMKLQDAIRTNDVIIDGTDHPQLAFFIGQDAFAKMQEAIKNIRTQKVSREELAKQIKAEAGENNTGKTDDDAGSDEAGSGIPS